MKPPSMSARLLVACIACILAIGLCVRGEEPPRNPLENVGKLPNPLRKPPLAPTGEGRIVLRPLTVFDPHFGCAAGTFAVPDGWKAEGAIVWNPDFASPVSPQARITNPNGLEQLWVYPHGRYVDGFRDFMIAGVAEIPGGAEKFGAPYPEGGHVGARHNLPQWGAEIRKRPPTPADYIKQFIIEPYRKELASAKIVQTQDEKEIAAMLAQMDAAIYRRSFPPQIDVDPQRSVTRIRMEYEVNGKAVEEEFWITMGDVSYPGLPDQGKRSPVGDRRMLPKVRCWYTEVISCRAEKGKLDKLTALFRCMAQSFRPDPAWYAAVVKETKNNMDLMRAIAAGQAGIDPFAKDARGETAADRVHRMWDETFRDVEGWRDSQGGGVVEVPLEFHHVYIDGQGNVVGSTTPLSPEALGAGGFQEAQKAQ